MAGNKDIAKLLARADASMKKGEKKKQIIQKHQIMPRKSKPLVKINHIRKSNNRVNLMKKRIKNKNKTTDISHEIFKIIGGNKEHKVQNNAKNLPRLPPLPSLPSQHHHQNHQNHQNHQSHQSHHNPHVQIHINEHRQHQQQRPPQGNQENLEHVQTQDNQPIKNMQSFQQKEHHLNKKEDRKEEKHGESKIVETYNLEVDKAKITINIRKNENGYLYELKIPQVNIATSALLKEIRNELVSLTSVSMKELIDPESYSAIKKRFIEDARRVLKEKLPSVEIETENFLVGLLMQDMLGLGKIEFLISDPGLEEIVIPSAKEPVRVYSKKYGWVSTSITIESEEEIVNYANIIARRVGRQITVLSPLLDAHLITGDRINAVLYPINTKGSTITIRKFARDPYTIIDFLNNKTCNLETAALIWLAIEYELNVLISGGTGSGKTSFLNACMPFIPPNHRIISIEDTRELMLPEFLYWTPLSTRTPNAEGKGEVAMLDLLINSLRMRPDRIVLGEMRRHEEAMVLFEAMHTGHSVYATLHADSSPETVSRLVNPPLDVPANLLKSVHLNVVMFRDRKRGIRRVYQIAEFEADKDEAHATILYRWSPEEDDIVKHSENSRFFETISRNTGMSRPDIDKELEQKRKILAWLAKNNIRNIQQFGKTMNMYYKNKEMLLDAINKNSLKIILGD